ncbi:ParB/RepB/Spo0J family partition protein [Acetobacter musti]|uniref:ParB/RepB/Spo0J family partition protein n=2 Tax=Acetobacter TaxID=434 RepID=A0ABX0JYD8_9PROT|nr:ParB/RepB/Spo0J family partition protein [Acetobacter musti]NHN86514.1 ParB/RepB/Spo0J family partition protein [Acetobacter musti]
MELREVDPKTLLDNPENPRTAAPNETEDRQLALNVKAVGIIHPPLVRETPDGLMIVAGHRRRRAAVKAGLKTIQVVVAGDDEELDRMRAASENMIRQPMTQVEQWRVISSLRAEKQWNDTAICKALMLTPVQLKQISRLSSVLPDILAWIEAGKGPESRELASIALASKGLQEQVWRYFGFPVGTEPPEDVEACEGDRVRLPDGSWQPGAAEPDWSRIASALRQDRFYAADASFDDAIAKSCRIVWQEDLFGEAGKDGRYTEDGIAYEKAQRQWLSQSTPEDAVIVQSDEDGEPLFEDGSARIYWEREGATKCFWLNHRLKVESGWCILAGSAAANRITPSAVIDALPDVPKERADISGRGHDMIGSFRTQALHATLDGMQESVDPWTLVGLMIAAFNAQNVRVEGDAGAWYPQRRPSQRLVAAAGLFQDGELALDETLLRGAAIRVLKAVLSCEKNSTNSGEWSVLVGHIVNADARLPTMADEDFLKTLSKPGITKVVQAEGILPRNTGKEMRKALMDRAGQGIWVHPEARFGLDVAKLNASFQEALSPPPPEASDDDLEDADEDETEHGDDAVTDGGAMAVAETAEPEQEIAQDDDEVGPSRRAAEEEGEGDPDDEEENPLSPPQTPDEFLRSHVEFIAIR